jgi:hypothetical protein
MCIYKSWHRRKFKIKRNNLFDVSFTYMETGCTKYIYVTILSENCVFFNNREYYLCTNDLVTLHTYEKMEKYQVDIGNWDLSSQDDRHIYISARIAINNPVYWVSHFDLRDLHKGVYEYSNVFRRLDIIIHILDRY